MKCGPTKLWTKLPLLALILLLSLRAFCGEALLCERMFDPEYKKPNRVVQVSAWLTGLGIGMVPYVALAAGGFSGSGGGEGVVSFSNPADAGLARRYLNAGDAIPDLLLDRARIVPLERWEMIANGVRPFAVPKGADWRTILQMAKQNMRLVSPIVARRLEQVTDWMEFTDWQDAGSLPYLGDASPNVEMSDKNVRTQLAIRLSAGNNKTGSGPATGGLNLKVLFDKRLFSRLEPIDQAMLVLHEELYALAQAIGHETSDEVRPLVQAFFSQHFLDMRARTKNGILTNELIAFFQQKMVSQFGDYAIFFSDFTPATRGEDRSADRHFAVFVDIVKEMREIQRQCLKLGLPGPQCAERTFNEFLARGTLDEERAFVFLSYFYLQLSGKVLNAEALMDNRSSAATYDEAISLACHYMRMQANSFITSDGQKAIDLAIRYCKAGR